jgi:hypothetical protein
VFRIPEVFGAPTLAERWRCLDVVKSMLGNKKKLDGFVTASEFRRFEAGNIEWKSEGLPCLDPQNLLSRSEFDLAGDAVLRSSTMASYLSSLP